MATKIEWCQETWNPVTGCTPISEGCQNCYAERMAGRLAGRYGYPKDDPFKVTVHLDRPASSGPMKWRKPRQIFVCSMGDLFHEDVPFDIPHHVFQTASECQHHTFIMLTKRTQRMLEFSRWMAGDDDISIAEWPRNCWIGVTAENQKRADERIPILLQIPAAVRFVSVEPMLGGVNLNQIHIGNDAFLSALTGEVWTAGRGPVESEFGRGLDWVICGGESGPGARPMHPGWVRSLRDQCVDAGVPFFFKQWGEYGQVDIQEPLSDSVFKKGPGHDGLVWKIGKKKSGRFLDGRAWDEYPIQ